MSDKSNLIELQDAPVAIPDIPPPKMDKRVYATQLMTRIPYNIHNGFIPINILDNPDPIMQLETGKGPAVYEDMTLDTVIDACWSKIINTITGMDWEVVSASEDAEDTKRRDFINDAFVNMNATLWSGSRHMGGFSAVLGYVVDGIRMGYTIPEVVWNLSEGKIVQMISHIPQAFTFMNAESGSNLGSDTTSTAKSYGIVTGGTKPWFSSQWTAQDLFYRPAPADAWQPAPPYKFIHCVYRPQYNDPWGRSQFRGAYWPYVFGFLDCMKWWSIFLDKWASPAIAYLADQVDWDNKEFITEILSVISNMQQSYAAVLPKSKDGSDNLKIIETNRSSTHSVFKDFFDSMNRLKCMALVGSALLMMESEFGTRAMAQTQAQYVHQDFIKGFCDYVMVNLQIPIAWMCDVKFGRSDNAKYPTFKLKYELPPDLKQELEIDSGLQKMGAKFAVDDIEQRYNRQFAKPDDSGVMPDVMEPLPPASPFGGVGGKPPDANTPPAGGIGNQMVQTEKPNYNSVSLQVPLNNVDDEFISTADLPKYKRMVLEKGGEDVTKFLRNKKELNEKGRPVIALVDAYGQIIESSISRIDLYSETQPRDDAGKWIDAGGASGAGARGDTLRKYPKITSLLKAEGYSDSAVMVDGIIHTDNVDDALRALTEDRRVELSQPRQVATLMDKLRERAVEMVKKGDKAPDLNLCNVSVRGTNIFCAEHLGFTRVTMPQVKDSVAMIDELKAKGVSITTETEQASFLRSTQTEIRGFKVARMAQEVRQGNRIIKPIFVSKDNYILDGHHNWAAAIALDTLDGKLGDVTVPVTRVDMNIIPLIKIAKNYSGPQKSLAELWDERAISLHQPMTVLRTWQGDVKRLADVKVFQDQEFLSATQNPELVKEGALCKIKVPKETKFLPYAKDELIFDRGTKLKINRISLSEKNDGQDVVEMEIVK